MFDDFGINAGYVEELHSRWLQSPHSVEADWQRFFEDSGSPPGATGTTAAAPPAAPSRNGNGSGKVASGNANGNGLVNGNANGNGVATVTAAVTGHGPPPSSVAYREAVRETVI